MLERTVASPEVIAQTYPASPDAKRISLYDPVLWRGLLRRYGRSVWRLLRRDDAMVALAEPENQKIALKEWLARAQ